MVLSIIIRFAPQDPESRIDGNISKCYLFTTSCLFRDVIVDTTRLPSKMAPRWFIAVWMLGW